MVVGVTAEIVENLVKVCMMLHSVSKIRHLDKTKLLSGHFSGIVF